MIKYALQNITTKKYIKNISEASCITVHTEEPDQAQLYRTENEAKQDAYNFGLNRSHKAVQMMVTVDPIVEKVEV